MAGGEHRAGFAVPFHFHRRFSNRLKPGGIQLFSGGWHLGCPFFLCHQRVSNHSPVGSGAGETRLYQPQKLLCATRHQNLAGLFFLSVGSWFVHEILPRPGPLAGQSDLHHQFCKNPPSDSNGTLMVAGRGRAVLPVMALPAGGPVPPRAGRPPTAEHPDCAAADRPGGAHGALPAVVSRAAGISVLGRLFFSTFDSLAYGCLAAVLFNDWRSPMETFGK